MSQPPASLMQQGLSALRGGDPATAEAAFLQLINTGKQDAATWLALAFARVNMNQAQGALEAVDRALALEPRNLRALLFKGDHLERMGEAQKALYFYSAALKIAANMQQIPPDIAQGLQRASGVSERFAREYEAYLLASLEARGVHDLASERCTEALQISFGKQAVHYQQPTRFYFPGLPQRAFYAREEFPWLAQLEAQTEAIRDELLSLNVAGDYFRPYLEANPDLPELNDRGNLDSMDWSACYLWRDGAVVDAVAELCPRTMAALEHVPLCQIPGQMPSVLFSQLAHGATIAAHHGAVNTRLICHLPLVVPADCGELRVGNYRHPWAQGETLIFDDSVEHEAWNHSREARIVLLFDIWRPELSDGERHWVSQMLQAVKAYGEQ